MTDESNLKYGRMISGRNAKILQQVMELVAQLVPQDEADPEQKSTEPDETLVAYGGAVKSLPGGKLGGMAIRFGGEDLTGDTFGRDTNYGFAGLDTKNVDILFHHAQPIETRTGRTIQVMEPIGRASLKMTDDGVLIEDAILFNSEKYARHLDRLGWSTGAAAHSVVREGGQIKQWQIAELSLTPTPAEPRNMVAAKSLAGEAFDIDDGDPLAGVDFRAIGREAGTQLAQAIQHIRQTAG